MLTVIAGENVVSSRQKLLDLKSKYLEKGYEVSEISVDNVESLLNDYDGVMNLFGQEPVYIVENLAKKYKGRAKTTFKEAVQNIAKKQTLHLISWEEGKSAYEISGLKRIASTFDEHKLDQNIFGLLENCYPKNLNIFLKDLEKVEKTQDAGFIYAMLCKHVRKLLLAKEDFFDKKTAPWQKSRIKSQSEKWEKKLLTNFYEGLCKIDRSIKTNSTTYDLKQSMEYLICYYLK